MTKIEDIASPSFSIKMIEDWDTFKERFQIYITETAGLFTAHEPYQFRHLHLDSFLNRQFNRIINNIYPIKPVQAEMLMALSAFIDIEESIHPISIEIFPEDIVYYFKLLIGNNLIRLSPHSPIRQEFVALQL